MPRTTPPAAVSIRPADVADADALHRLCQALGRDAQLHDVRAHLQEVASEAGRCLLVAVVEGAVGGWLEVGARTALGTRPWAEVSGLVVDAPLRGLGLGRALLLAARRWAKEKGLVPLRVRTRLEREAAARFYESAGMTRRKQQWVFEIEG